MSLDRQGAIFDSVAVASLQSAQLYGSWSAIRGTHSLKIGGDARQYRLNIINYGNATGTFAFSANNFVRSASSASTTVALGQDMATFLLGRWLRRPKKLRTNVSRSFLPR